MSLPREQPNSAMAAELIISTRKLAGTLYHSTSQSSDLINQAQNELCLLLSVLRTTEAHSATGTSNNDCLPELQKTVQNCHEVLLDLQTLQEHPNSVGPQSQVTNIRASLSSCIFDLSLLNTNLVQSSQNKIDKILQKFVDEVRSGKRTASLIANNSSNDLPAKSQTKEGWEQLQAELETVGIAPEVFTKDREFIITTLQNALAKNSIEDNGHPDTRIVENFLDHGGFPVSIGPEPHRVAVPQQSHSDKELLPTEYFPIPLAFAIGMAGAEKQVLPKDNLLIPIAVETRHETNFQKQVFPTNSVQVPVEPQPGTAPTEERSQAGERRKASRMSRVFYRMTHRQIELIKHISWGKVDVVRHELEKGADVESESFNGQSALMVATTYGYENVVQLLLDYGAQINKVARDGRSALGIAAENGFERIVRQLLEHGAGRDTPTGFGKLPLAVAAIQGYDRIVQILLDHGSNVNALSDSGNTALGQAAKFGNERAARLLLANGAMVDKSRYPGVTPLYNAVSQGHAGMVRLLLEKGADPYLEDYRGNSPLSKATMLNRRAVLKVMAEYGHSGLVQYG